MQRTIQSRAEISALFSNQWKSPNHIDPTTTFTAFLIAVLAGARRFAHANWLRGGRALHALLGLSRFPFDDTIRNLFRRFGWATCIVSSTPWPSRRWNAYRNAGGVTAWTGIPPS